MDKLRPHSAGSNNTEDSQGKTPTHQRSTETKRLSDGNNFTPEIVQDSLPVLHVALDTKNEDQVGHCGQRTNLNPVAVHPATDGGLLKVLLRKQ